MPEAENPKKAQEKLQFYLLALFYELSFICLLIGGGYCVVPGCSGNAALCHSTATNTTGALPPAISAQHHD